MSLIASSSNFFFNVLKISISFFLRLKVWLPRTTIWGGLAFWWQWVKSWRRVYSTSAGLIGTWLSRACPVGRWSTVRPKQLRACINSACPPGPCEKPGPGLLTLAHLELLVEKRQTLKLGNFSQSSCSDHFP